MNDSVGTEPGASIPLSDRFAEVAADAELLLRYAAESGIAVPLDIVEPILLARTVLGAKAWTDRAICAFYSAFTRLAAMLKPVSIASLKTPEGVIAQNVGTYRRWGIALTCIVVLLSMLSFVNSGIAERISRDIEENNLIAATLRAQLGPSDTQYTKTDQICVVEKGPIASPGLPAVGQLDTIIQLQHFASVLRDVDSRSVKLNWFVLRAEQRPDFTMAQMQLDPQLADFHRAAFCKIGVYEEVRNFAQNILADDTVIYGAVTAYLLPVLYALLGAFAFQIRRFTDQISTRSFEKSRVNVARMIAAVVAGSIVSLFNGFTQGATLSPLAIAFLVGYGVEIFYAFLDRMIAAFASNGAMRTQPSPPNTLAKVTPGSGS
jgi:hypothetical protein